MLKKMIDALLAAGYSQVALQDLTGIPQSTISRISKNRQVDVGYSRGKKLERLYEKHLLESGSVSPGQGSLFPEACANQPNGQPKNVSSSAANHHQTESA